MSSKICPAMLPDGDTATALEYEISIETLMATVSLYGDSDSRHAIAARQDAALADKYGERSKVPFPAHLKPGDFVVAPLDIMPFMNGDGEMRHQLLELNGAGFAGSTNLPKEIRRRLRQAFADVAQQLLRDKQNQNEPSPPVVLIGSSGREVAGHNSHLIHEKVEIAEAMRTTFGPFAQVISLDRLKETRQDNLMQSGATFANGAKSFSYESEAGCMHVPLNASDDWQPVVPTVVVGYSKDFAVMPAPGGVPHLFGRCVDAIINDRTVLNLQYTHGAPLDLTRFQAVNACFVAGQDKGAASALANSFNLLNAAAGDAKINALGLEQQIQFSVVTREEGVAGIADAVIALLRQGTSAVIKPSGTGHGDGIEFFFVGNPMDHAAIFGGIERSLATVKVKYGSGGGFPYTVMHYLNAAVVKNASNGKLKNHKYELRIVVYRDGAYLKACPAIAKVSGEAWNPAIPTTAALTNNISATMKSKGGSGAEHILPLCNVEEATALSLTEADLTLMCQWSTRYVAHVLEQSIAKNNMRPCST